MFTKQQNVIPKRWLHLIYIIEKKGKLAERMLKGKFVK